MKNKYTVKVSELLLDYDRQSNVGYNICHTLNEEYGDYSYCVPHTSCLGCGLYTDNDDQGKLRDQLKEFGIQIIDDRVDK